MSQFDIGTAGTTAINTILAEEANRIGSDIYSRTLHTSPWLDLTKQSAFPDGMGYQQTTLVYDRAIATTTAAGGIAGVNWNAVGGQFGRGPLSISNKACYESPRYSGRSCQWRTVSRVRSIVF